ncbi:FkbM family methyltransferase [Leptospira langatensis]|uniref:FkbM family methyltransferase n=1 Tax=Leptospira langatensis TaxID=2484983 RepID=A0A5F1ZTM1_9LEPT|nr:FkbM family methyltransferase [Leptospira langatensis]TGK02610.1 FkbM family methyltransferase [Leptospira langatensis]TGL40188.1 FkbM family methyltransferase [Leptospira langatensis]
MENNSYPSNETPPFEQLNLLQKFIRLFEPLENIIPSSYRMPFRYYAQYFFKALEPEIFILSDLIPKNGIAIDIGANRGIYAYALSKLASKVECFEPIPKCVKYLQDYGSNKITVHNVALSDQSGSMKLYIPILKGRTTLTRASLNKPNGPYVDLEVEIKTLDSFNFPKVDFIKIDVEGLESNVIKGASKTISQYRPKLLIEIDHHRNSAESFGWIFSFFEKLKYKPYLLRNGKLEECKDPKQEALLQYNFIFLPT